jgi:GntR family transcriptional regulator
VRQALGDLQKEGLIFKIHGKGTFVAKPKAFQNVSTLQGLAESMTQMGYEVLNRLRSFRHVPASALVAQRLQVEEGSLVTEIRQVRLINREPVSLEITWLPPASARSWRRPTWSPATSSCCWRTTAASPSAMPTWPSTRCSPTAT